MGNSSSKDSPEELLLMSDVIEGEDLSSAYTSEDTVDGISRRDSQSNSSAQSNQLSSMNSVNSKRESPAESTVPIASPPNPRPKMMPGILKKGRSMPFMDVNDAVPLSPINESPHRTGTQQRYFFNNPDTSPETKGLSPRSPAKSPNKLSILSPRSASIHCSYDSAVEVVDELTCEYLLPEEPMRKRPAGVPELMTSTSGKPPLNRATFASGQATLDPSKRDDSVMDFEAPAPMLKAQNKRWASEGNILKHGASAYAASILHEPDNDLTGRVVNGSPDVERAQKKIEYIVEAVKEVGQSSGVAQTPRLALSRHNSKIDPKMLESSSHSS